MDPESFDKLSPGHILNANGKSYRIEKVSEVWMRQGGDAMRIVTLADSDIRTLTVSAKDARYHIEAGTFIYTRSHSGKIRLIASSNIMQADIIIPRLALTHPMAEMASDAIKRMQRVSRKKDLKTLKSICEATQTPLAYTLTYIKGDNVFIERILLRDLTKRKT